MFHVYESSRVSHMLVENSKRVKQETFHTCCFPLSCPHSHKPVQKCMDVFSWKARRFDIRGLFEGSTRFPLAGQAEGARAVFVLYVV